MTCRNRFFMARDGPHLSACTTSQVMYEVTFNMGKIKLLRNLENNLNGIRIIKL